MPRTTIPLISDLGFYSPNDLPGSDAHPSQASFLNGYFEKGPGSPAAGDDRKLAYVKRPGVPYNAITGFTAGHKIQGFWVSIDRTKAFLYSNNGVTNTVWYWDGSSLTNRGVAPAAVGSWTITGPVVATMLDGISYGAGNYYAVTDFTKGATVSSVGVWTEITDVDFVALVKATNFMALDGYLFIGTTNNRIYNSDLNTPSSWQATSFLTAADTPGNLLWLSKIRNFLIAFKDRSIEFFEDVGNPTPGSPLEPRRQYNRTIGCINKSSIREMSDGIIFAGVAENSAPKMYKIHKTDLSIVEISTRYVEQVICNGYFSTYNVDITADGALKGQSQSFSLNGKEFYTISFNAPAFSSNTDAFTLVYDNDLGIWTQWVSYFTSASGDGGFLPSQAQMMQSSATGITTVGIAFVNNTTSPPKIMFVQNISGSTSNSGVFKDGGVAGNTVIFGWTSDVFEFGSRRRKFMDSFEVLYECMSGTGFDPPFANQYSMTLTYMDWPYYAIGSAYLITKTLPFDTGGGLRCIAKQLGTFRKRAFTLRQTVDCPFKIWAIEVDLNEGETDEG